MTTRDGVPLTATYRNLTDQTIWLPVRNEDGKLSADSIPVPPGETFHPTPDLNVRALVEAVVIGKVTPKKQKPASNAEE